MSHSTHGQNRTFSVPIPFDPLRLLYGVRQRWVWFLIFPLICSLIGCFIGGTQAEDRYTVSLQLIKTGGANTLQTSESGQAFKPRNLSDDTLLSTTYSSEVLYRTGQRLDKPRSPLEVKSMVEIAKQRNTSLFYLTAHSRETPEDAINLVNVWAEEIIRFTNNLQRAEARQMEAFISEQLDAIDAQLLQVNGQILEFSAQHNFVDVNSQTVSALGALEAARGRLVNAQIDLESKEVQIRRYRDELRAQSPLESDMKKSREELSVLRGSYTDENPLVKEKLHEIEYISKQLEVAALAPMSNLKDFTGSDLGNNLYLEIISLESERIQLERLVASLKLELEERKSLVAGIPAKALRLSELNSRRNLLIDAQSLLDSRRKEASFYETKAPGYWQIFQQPNLSEVAFSSQNLKVTVLGLIGGGVGVVLALFMALSWEAFQPGLRTPLEAVLATSCLPLFSYITKEGTKRSWLNARLFSTPESCENDRNLRTFWLTHAVGDSSSTTPRRFLFVHTDQSVDEAVFWQGLLDLLGREGRRVTFAQIGPASDKAVNALSDHPAVAAWVQDLKLVSQESDHFVFINLNRIPTIDEVSYLSEVDAYYLFSSPSVASRSETRHVSNLLRELLGPASGLLLVDQAAGRSVPRILNWLEMKVLNALVYGQSGGREV
jgi:uncharacterized protein involved in exopolysaccharide biosynthesis